MQSSYAANGSCVWPATLIPLLEKLTIWQSPKLWWAVSKKTCTLLVDVAARRD